jgi:hypothetical protein
MHLKQSPGALELTPRTFAKLVIKCGSLRGAKAPFVLRPVARGGYFYIIGEAIVVGFMEGAIYDIDKEQDLEVIKLMSRDLRPFGANRLKCRTANTCYNTRELCAKMSGVDCYFRIFWNLPPTTHQDILPILSA